MIRTAPLFAAAAALALTACAEDPTTVEGTDQTDLDNVDTESEREAAAAALDDINTMSANAAKVRRTRQRLSEALRRLDFFVWNSKANFVLARSKTASARELYEGLKERRILVRYFSEDRLRNCLRISVGTNEETDKLLEVLSEIV